MRGLGIGHLMVSGIGSPFMLSNESHYFCPILAKQENTNRGYSSEGRTRFASVTAPPRTQPSGNEIPSHIAT